MAISETKGQEWWAIHTYWRKASDILTSTLAVFCSAATQKLNNEQQHKGTITQHKLETVSSGPQAVTAEGARWPLMPLFCEWLGLLHPSQNLAHNSASVCHTSFCVRKTGKLWLLTNFWISWPPAPIAFADQGQTWHVTMYWLYPSSCQIAASSVYTVKRKSANILRFF